MAITTLEMPVIFEYLNKRIDTNAWMMLFEIVWWTGAASLVYYVFKCWPAPFEDLPVDEKYGRMLVCGLFAFCQILIRSGFYSRKTLRAFVINGLTSSMVVTMAANVYGLIDVRELAVAFTLLILSTIYIIMQKHKDGSN